MLLHAVRWKTAALSEAAEDLHLRAQDPKEAAALARIRHFLQETRYDALDLEAVLRRGRESVTPAGKR